MINRYVVSVSLLASLFLLSAFTVPLVAPLRSSSAHAILALVILLVALAMGAVILFARDRAPADLEDG